MARHTTPCTRLRRGCHSSTAVDDRAAAARCPRTGRAPTRAHRCPWPCLRHERSLATSKSHRGHERGKCAAKQAAPSDRFAAIAAAVKDPPEAPATGVFLVRIPARASE
eukprot:scaffold422_cov247-Pinguiococcus_pyrenoidosus.AAC.9